MHYLLGRFKVGIDVWKQAIESDKASHKEAGLQFKRLWKNVDNPAEIFFLFEVENLKKAKSFLQQAGALDKKKQENGEIPELIFLESA